MTIADSAKREVTRSSKVRLIDVISEIEGRVTGFELDGRPIGAESVARIGAMMVEWAMKKMAETDGRDKPTLGLRR